MRPANSSCVGLSEAQLSTDEGRITIIRLLASLASGFNCDHQFIGHCSVRLPAFCNPVDIPKDGFNSGCPVRQGLPNRPIYRRGKLWHAAIVAVPGLPLCALPRIRTAGPAADPTSVNTVSRVPPARPPGMRCSQSRIRLVAATSRITKPLVRSLGLMGKALHLFHNCGDRSAADTSPCRNSMHSGAFRAALSPVRARQFDREPDPS
jgi:hypothetical protein